MKNYKRDLKDIMMRICKDNEITLNLDFSPSNNGGYDPFKHILGIGRNIQEAFINNYPKYTNETLNLLGMGYDYPVFKIFLHEFCHHKQTMKYGADQLMVWSGEAHDKSIFDLNDYYTYKHERVANRYARRYYRNILQEISK